MSRILWKLLQSDTDFQTNYLVEFLGNPSKVRNLSNENVLDLHVLRRAHRSQLLKFPAGVREVLREVRDALRLAFSPALVLLQE